MQIQIHKNKAVIPVEVAKALGLKEKEGIMFGYATGGYFIYASANGLFTKSKGKELEIIFAVTILYDAILNHYRLPKSEVKTFELVPIDVNTMHGEEKRMYLNLLVS